MYDWQRFEKTVRQISPKTIVFSDIGPDIRWCGNENGIAGKTNWNCLDTAGFKRGAGAPPQDTLNSGNVNGAAWIPAECDVSIRPGWFYHKAEDDKVKTAEQLFELYLKSVGRGANLLLNVPPDGNGLISLYDAASLAQFQQLRKQQFSNNLSLRGRGYSVPQNISRPAPALNDGNSRSFELLPMAGLSSFGIEFPAAKKINCVVLREFLKNGQHCRAYSLLLLDKGHHLLKEINGTTIGRSRIISFPAIDAAIVTVSITDQKGVTAISEIETYLIDEKLVEKEN